MATNTDASKSPQDDAPPVPPHVDGPEWTLRRAEWILHAEVQEALLGHRLRLAATAAEHEREVSRITADAARQESASLDSMRAESLKANASLEQRAVAAQKLHDQRTQTYLEADAALRAEARKLAQSQNRSWLDALEKYYEAQGRYQSIVDEVRTTIGAAAFGRSPAASQWAFALAGDEGAAWQRPIDEWPAAWSRAFVVAGDEGASQWPREAPGWNYGWNWSRQGR